MKLSYRGADQIDVKYLIIIYVYVLDAIRVAQVKR